MKKWLPLCFLCSSSLYAAESNLPGSYLREFSDPNGNADFIIAAKNGSWSVVGFDAYLPGKQTSAKDKSALFKRMNWQITHPDTAECISFDMQAICYLPATENKTTDGAALDAGYYYYDPLSGVSKLKKL
jgi:hypothetical protein